LIIIKTDKKKTECEKIPLLIIIKFITAPEKSGEIIEARKKTNPIFEVISDKRSIVFELIQFIC